MEEIMKKASSIVAAAVLFISLFTPPAVFAGLSVEQVQKNVENLWQPLMQSLPKVTAVEFKKIMDKGDSFVLLDVRREAEYEAAHLPGAINITRGVLEFETPKKIVDSETKIYVYCRTGARASFAVKRLNEMGYPNVVNISDSFKGWVEAGYPVYNRHGEFILTPGGFEKKEK
jgi:rhodanese-related sulfurtransferase